MPDRDSIQFFSPEAPTTVGTNRLPHWDQQGRIYNLTWRLADSIPAHLLREFQIEETIWRDHHPEPWSPEIEFEYLRRFVGRIEHELDLHHGECLLRKPDCASIVAQALQHFEGKRTRLHAWIVMPNHVRVLSEILEGYHLPDLMHSWKGFTSRQINQHLDRSGTLWQKGYHDRLIRDWDHFANVVAYFRRNPIKGHLKAGEYLAGESELAKVF